MIGLKVESCLFEEEQNHSVSVAFHSSFYRTYKKLKKWLARFPLSIDSSIINDLILFYSLAKKKYLDHRHFTHLFRLILSIYHFQRKLLSCATLTPHARHLAVRWLPTKLLFPFSSKPVLGCLIGFNVMDRYELFDEENIIVALQKHFPELQIVKESNYCHNSQHENLKLFYFEIEKKNGASFTYTERMLLKNNLEEKIKNSIQKLVPSVFMKLNQEEVYKNILILSQEITSVNDLPQVYITLDQHSANEVIFHVSLVQISPMHKISLKDRLVGCTFVLDRFLPVCSLNGHQIEAYLFRLLLPTDSSLLRSDGSLDFYATRQRVVSLLTSAIGEFRDYNGGLLIKQQELLYSFKESLPEEAMRDAEFMETFFYSLVPLEKQALLDTGILAQLFVHFSKHRKERFLEPLSIRLIEDKNRIFISVRGDEPSMNQVISNILRSHVLNTKELAYNLLETAEGNFFNCVLLNAESNEVSIFIQSLQEALHIWDQKRKKLQVLRVALGHSVVSLDPRVGGENVSSGILNLLFEGLTRFDQTGQIENGVAESIDVSSDLKVYTFKLRPCFWNDGSLVSAHDFAYSWKKVLSPDFTTSFAGLFYPIKNAKDAKSGKVPIDTVGIRVLSDKILQVELERPAPYFLQLTALSLFAPVHRKIDRECPQWPYQSQRNYPCNGPFQLKINQPNQAYFLVKNPLYWNCFDIELDQITLTVMDPFHAMHAFAKNEIDWIGTPFSPWHASYTPGNEGNILSCSNPWVCCAVFNTDAFPFKHPKMRRALALAFDRSEFMKDRSFSMTPAYSILPARFHESKQMVFPDYHREKAVSLFEEALQEMGLSRKEFSIQFPYFQKGAPEYTAKIIKRQLEDIFGIDCQLQPLHWDALFRRMSDGKFQMGLMHWTMLIDDPAYTLNAFKFSKEGINFSKWENLEFQNLLDLSEEEINPFQRSSYLHKAEANLAENLPIVPLFYQPYQALVRSDFQLIPASCGFFNIARGFYKKRK